MIVDLDDPRATDPVVAGAKGAGLARARQAGLPVLPGFVVAAEAGRSSLARGAATLPHRGSGGARSAVLAVPLDPSLAGALSAAVARVPEPLIVRSSSALEGDGRWAGAFTSYLAVGRDEVATAVRGCWASAFSVAAVDRAEAAGVDPATAMAVVVQPSIEPACGGIARFDGDDVVVVGVVGSPAPLVQGWDPGVTARVSADGGVLGAAAVELLGAASLRGVARILRDAHVRLGSTRCEWAADSDGRVTLLQVGDEPPRERSARTVPDVYASAAAARLARVVRRTPGPLGQRCIVPWALGEANPPDRPTPSLLEDEGLDADDALARAIELADRLVASVWGTAPVAVQAALGQARGTKPDDVLARIATLTTADPGSARTVRHLVDIVRRQLVAMGEVPDIESAWYVSPDRAAAVLAGVVTPGRARIGVDRWEPFGALVTLRHGQAAEGTEAAPGLGYGRLCFVPDPGRSAHLRPRDVIVTTHPTPGFGALLWDAAGIVTLGGGPAAHLFEAARSVGIPAVAGVHLDEILGMRPQRATGCVAVAVDGDFGSVAVMPW